MTDNQLQDPAWGAWDDVMRSVLPLMRDQEFSAALEAVNAFLLNQIDAELCSSVLGMRAQLKQDLGDLEGAKADLLSAISLLGAGFARHVNEFSLAEIYRKQGDHAEVVAWYRAALRTCAQGDFPGGAALRKFLELQPQEILSAEDRALCVEVARRSWDLLGLPGRPDFTKLSAVASAIVEREANPPLKARG